MRKKPTRPLQTGQLERVSDGKLEELCKMVVGSGRLGSWVGIPSRKASDGKIVLARLVSHLRKCLEMLRYSKSQILVSLNIVVPNIASRGTTDPGIASIT